PSSEGEAREGVALGMIQRASVHVPWTNGGYRDFDDFLSTFSHDRSKKVKQERRKLADAGVSFEQRCGGDITAADWAFFYQCYESTYRAHHSTPYLTPSFFEEIGARLAGHTMLVLGTRKGRRLCRAPAVYSDR